jgi:hypothetical protein
VTVDHYTHEQPDWPIVVYQAIAKLAGFNP